MTLTRVGQKTTFLDLHSISRFFPFYWVTWSHTKKIRSLAQFFRSAQLTWIFWLFDALLLYENCQKTHQNQCFCENCLLGAKNMIFPKIKVVPVTLRNSWFHDKKIYKEKIFLGDLWGPKNGKKSPKWPYSWTPYTP